MRPAVYHRLHFRTKEVIAVSFEELKKEGRPFPEVVRAFFRWCGEDYRFCTFGTLDLTELQRNLSYYKQEGFIKGPVFYEDVQKLFAIAYETRKERRALSYVVDYLKIEDNGEFHQALDDAVYTARVLQKIPDDVILKNFSIDCYETPKSREEEIRVRYETYEKFISREFPSKEAVMADRMIRQVRCFACGDYVRREIPWFSDSGKNYYTICKCPKHGFVKSKARVRRAADGNFFGIKTTRLIDETDVEKILKKQSFLKAKRRKKERGEDG